MELKDCFGFSAKEVVMLVGSGGKTSTMEYLSNAYRNEKVLIGTTTKIGFPTIGKYDSYVEKIEELTEAEKGITLVGVKDEITGKLFTIESEDFSSLLPKFDKAFIEADGSKRLPLKGWKSFEPVILNETTMTIGIVPIKVCGKKISSETVHRTEEFLAMTSASMGDDITPRLLAKMIANENGLFGKASGRNVLAINQVESKKDLTLSFEVVMSLPKSFFGKLDRIIAMSCCNREGFILWEK